MDDRAAPSHAGLLVGDVRWAVMSFLGLTILAGCLTTLFLAMRALLDIGGACAVGGAFEVATECPPGVGLSIPVSIWIGLVGLGLLIAGSVHLGGPRLWLLSWSALFLSLGWNFFEFGVLRADDAGTDWTYVLCAVLFGFMGAWPLWPLLGSRTGRRSTLWADSASGAARRRAARAARDVLMLTQLGTASASPQSASRRAVRLDLPFPEQSSTPAEVDDGSPLTPPPTSASPSTAAMAPPDRSVTPVDAAPAATLAPPPGWDPVVADRFVAELERLAMLHERGALDDAEFQAAKHRLLAGGRT